MDRLLSFGNGHMLHLRTDLQEKCIYHQSSPYVRDCSNIVTCKLLLPHNTHLMTPTLVGTYTTGITPITHSECESNQNIEHTCMNSFRASIFRSRDL